MSSIPLPQMSRHTGQSEKAGSKKPQGMKTPEKTSEEKSLGKDFASQLSKAGKAEDNSEKISEEVKTKDGKKKVLTQLLDRLRSRQKEVDGEVEKNSNQKKTDKTLSASDKKNKKWDLIRGILEQELEQEIPTVLRLHYGNAKLNENGELDQDQEKLQGNLAKISDIELKDSELALMKKKADGSNTAGNQALSELASKIEVVDFRKMADSSDQKNLKKSRRIPVPEDREGLPLTEMKVALEESLSNQEEGGASSFSENDGESSFKELAENRGFEAESSPKGILSRLKGSNQTGFPKLLGNQNQLEMVEKAKILLKDQNRGELRLILQPEALGKVRIRMNLEGGHLAGRILVDNLAAKELLEGQLDELVKSFEDGSFESASLEVALSGGDAGNQNPQQTLAQDQKAFEEERNLWGLRKMAKNVVQQQPALTGTKGSWQGQINLVV